MKKGKIVFINTAYSRKEPGSYLCPNVKQTICSPEKCFGCQKGVGKLESAPVSEINQLENGF